MWKKSGHNWMPSQHSGFLLKPRSSSLPMPCMFHMQGQYCHTCQTRYFGDPILIGSCSKCTCPLNKECDSVTGDCSDTCGGNTRVRSQNTNRYKYCHHQPHICWKINFQIGALFFFLKQFNISGTSVWPLQALLLWFKSREKWMPGV